MREPQFDHRVIRLQHGSQGSCTLVGDAILAEIQLLQRRVTVRDQDVTERSNALIGQAIERQIETLQSDIFRQARGYDRCSERGDLVATQVQLGASLILNELFADHHHVVIDQIPVG